MSQSFIQKDLLFHVCVVLFLGFLVFFLLKQTESKEAASALQNPGEEVQYTENNQTNESHQLAPETSREQIADLLEQAEVQLRSAEWLVATQDYTSPGGQRLLIIYREHRPSEMIWYTLSNYDGSGDHYLLHDGEWYYSHQKGVFGIGMHSSIGLARDYKLNSDPPASDEWQLLHRATDLPEVTLSLITWQEADRSAMIPQVIFPFVQLMDDDRNYKEKTGQVAGDLIIYTPSFDYSRNDILWAYSVGVYSVIAYGQSLKYSVRDASNMGIFYQFDYLYNMAFALPKPMPSG